MAEIEMKQFKLTDEGVILFQPDPSNPLPGKPVARIKKGDALLQPAADVTEPSIDAEKVLGWLQAYINETLFPLAVLKEAQEADDIPEPARAIVGKLYESLGIVPRAELEEPIAVLDEAGRAALRARKVRLGPVLVFLPLLNKPAGVRLRALLWNLWHGKTLPASVPADGVTSVSVADKPDIDPLYYRSIGYPVYGPRAIRVDMLDRLISAIYEIADKGVFKARHDMAEWLGCPIPDLYAVLEAMDHKKIHDPAEAQAEKAEQDGQPEQAAPILEEAGDAADKAAEDAEKQKPDEEGSSESEAGAAGKPAPQIKPELATFRLRRGKAYGKEPHKKRLSGKPEQRAGQKQQSFKKKPFKSHRPKKPPHQEPRERIISAAPQKKMEDSPFAILKELKVQNKE